MLSWLTITIALVLELTRGDDCFNGLEYVLVEKLDVTKADAENFCSELGGGATLVKFQSEEEFDFALELALTIGNNRDIDMNFWTGFERVDQATAIDDPVSFGFSPGSLASVANQFPWPNNQPLSDTNIEFQGGLNGDCVRVSLPEQDLISRDCQDLNFALCTRPCEIKVSSCDPQESLEYIYLPERLEFFDISGACESFDGEASMAKPTSEREFNLLQQFVEDTNPVRNYWIEYFREDVEDDERDPLSYGIEANSFGDSRGDFPWAGEAIDIYYYYVYYERSVSNNQPNNRFSDTDDKCVEVRTSVQRWQVKDCEDGKSTFCQRQCTQKPTEAPTKNPTFEEESNGSFTIGVTLWGLGGLFCIFSAILMVQLNSLGKSLSKKRMAIEQNTISTRSLL